MRLIRMTFRRLRNLILSGRLDRDTRDELQAHYDHEISANLASGLSPQEARRAATLDIGRIDPLVDASRDARGLRIWDALRGDLRYAFRQIRKRPGFSAAAILTLAIGVGATAAVFAVVDAVVLRPLPYPNADRLYSIYEFNTRSNIGRTRATPLNYIDWRDQAKSFSGMAGHIGSGFTLTGRGDARFTLGQLVTTNLLDVLGVKPALGRAFVPADGKAGNHQVVILTHSLWVSAFAADPNVIETTTTINGQPYRIVGVMPASYSYPGTDYQLLVPFVMEGTVPGGPPINRGSRFLQVVGRLQDGVDPAAASAELETIGKRLADAFPESNETVSVRMNGLTAQTVGDSSSSLVIVLVAVGFVLLIACVNVAGLTIARGQARTRELAVRAAIGASRGRLVAQLATEGLVLFAIGGTLGLALAAWIVSALSASLPATLPRIHEIAIDARFVAIAGGVTLVTGLIFSVLPALQVARRRAAGDLVSSRGTVSASASTQRARVSLIVIQIAAAVVLVTGAALAVRSFQRLNATDKGYTLSHTMTMNFVLMNKRYPGAVDIRNFIARTNEAIAAAAPGAIESVGTTTHLPLADNNMENAFTVDGVAAAAGGNPPIAGVRGVTGRYLQAIGARLLEGRDFTDADGTGQPVAIVTAGFATRYIEPRPVIGARIKMGDGGSDDPWRTVIGVIADIRHNGLDREPRPEVWMPLAQIPDGLVATWFRGVNVVVRTGADPISTVPALRQVMKTLDPELPLINVRSMETLAAKSTAERTLETALLAAFAAIALALAAIGLFGVLAFYVAQHLQEFGVRLALGATPSGLLSLILRRGAFLLALGLAVGLPSAVLLGRGMSTLLFGIEPLDLPALSAAVALLTMVTAMACLVPARRAMRTDPVRVLRTD
jgi:putative ABC transport system permease protein